MSKRLRLGHAAVNCASLRTLAELHGFTPRRDPALGFLCVSNLVERRGGGAGKEKWLIRCKRAGDVPDRRCLSSGVLGRFLLRVAFLGSACSVALGFSSPAG